MDHATPYAALYARAQELGKKLRHYAYLEGAEAGSIWEALADLLAVAHYGDDTFLEKVTTLAEEEVKDIESNYRIITEPVVIQAQAYDKEILYHISELDDEGNPSN